MNTNIYIDNELLQRITEYTKKEKISRSLLIREALIEWFNNHERIQWKENFFEFEGVNDFPLAADLRNDLELLSDDPFV